MKPILFVLTALTFLAVMLVEPKPAIAFPSTGLATSDKSAADLTPAHYRRYGHCHWRGRYRYCHSPYARRYYRPYTYYRPYYYRPYPYYRRYHGGPGIYFRFGF